MSSAENLRKAAIRNAHREGLVSVQEGTPLCSCVLGPFGDIDVADPFCEGTDMH